jgi:energy-coupling factor transporter ATP-binding protein EcfA2
MRGGLRKVRNVVVTLALLGGLLALAFVGASALMGGRSETAAPERVEAEGWGVVRAVLWHLTLSTMVFGLMGLTSSLVRWSWRRAGGGMMLAAAGWPGGMAGGLGGEMSDAEWAAGGASTVTGSAVALPQGGGAPAGPLDVDPERTPHVLIVGKTGSGKSTLARALLARFVRRYRAEVVVCDPDGVNWLDQTSASTTEGIAAAIDEVHEEFSRRQALLSSGRPEEWPYVVLLLEETETVFERLEYVGDEVEDRARFNLREIARMGRKARVFLWAVTQVAAGDVFDLHVRRNMTVFCALSEPGVGRMLGVPKEVDLTRLAPGMVYAANEGQVVGFESASRVRLPLSRLGREGRESQPVAQPVAPPAATGFWGQFEVVDPVVAVDAVVRLEPGRQPTREEAAEMRKRKRQGWSQNRICHEFYGYKDGVVNAFVKTALEGGL